jgi:hypothetical protein
MMKEMNIPSPHSLAHAHVPAHACINLPTLKLLVMPLEDRMNQELPEMEMNKDALWAQKLELSHLPGQRKVVWRHRMEGLRCDWLHNLLRLRTRWVLRDVGILGAEINQEPQILEELIDYVLVDTHAKFRELWCSQSFRMASQS